MNDTKPFSKKKKIDDKQVMKLIIVILGILVLLYAFINFYYSLTGSIRSEYINYVVENVTIGADGFVIRDEVHKDGNENLSVLKKNQNGIYAPVVKEGESVSENGSIAYIFAQESQLSAYNELCEINDKIELLSRLQDNGNIGCLDVSMLNSEIASAVKDYVGDVDNNDFSQLDSKISNIDYKITSKQIATGTEMNFTKEINSLEKQKKKLEKKLGSPKTVKSPCAGYFVSSVDGYENSYSFDKVGSDGITSTQIDKLLKSKPKSTSDTFGKIIGEHIWYFVFNMPFNTTQALKKGKVVSVSFPQSNINDLKMKVVKIEREEKSDSVSVILKCTMMNDKLLGLRKENALVTIATYYGYRINKDAINSYNDQLGVFVYSGSRVVFKPIEIVYDAADYVIAVATEYKNEEDDESEDRVLRAYDKVIVKGRNLYDRKVIG